MVMRSAACTVSMGSLRRSYIGQVLAHHGFLAHQDYSNAQIPGGIHCAGYFRLWRVISAHCIHGNG
jgi:hypothetical protein